MMPGWYRKAVNGLGHEPASLEQLTTPGDMENQHR